MDGVLLMNTGKLWNACLMGGEDAPKEVQKLIDEGEDVDELDGCGRPPLWVACRYGDNRVAKVLLDAGATVDWKTKEGGDTPLIRSCGDSWSHTEVVHLLLARGVDVNETNKKGWTPLMHACMARNTGLVKLLLKHGADRNVKVEDEFVKPGHTAADLANLCAPEGKEIAKLVEPTATGA